MKKNLNKTKIKEKNNNKMDDKVDNKSFKGFIVFAIVVFLFFFSIYISNNNFRKFVDTNILRKVVKEEKLKEIYESVSTQNTFLSNKFIHILDSGEIKNYDRNGNLISTNILSIGSAVSDNKEDYMILGEKGGRRIFLFERGKLKWERELDVNISNVYINKNGKISVIGNSSMYNSVIVLVDENGNQYLKKYLRTKYAGKAQISEDNKFLVLALIDYAKIQISSEIEIIDIDKAVKDESGAIVKTYTKDKLILDIETINGEETLVRYIDEIYLIDKNEEKKVHDIAPKTMFVNININDGFVEVSEVKSNILAQTYVLKIYDKYGSESGTLMLDDEMPKNMITHRTNILIETPKTITIASDMGWLKKKYSSKRNFLDVKVSEGLVAIIYSDKISLISI